MPGERQDFALPASVRLQDERGRVAHRSFGKPEDCVWSELRCGPDRALAKRLMLERHSQQRFSITLCGCRTSGRLAARTGVLLERRSSARRRRSPALTVLPAPLKPPALLLDV